MKKLFLILILITIVLPGFALAQSQTDPAASNLIPCTNYCDFKDFIHLINNVIKFVLLKLVVPIAVIMFVYGGFKLLVSGGNTEALASAKRILLNTVIGVLLAGGAWLIVKSLLYLLGYTDAGWIGF